jgi:hypothetical protein
MDHMCVCVFVRKSNAPILWLDSYDVSPAMNQKGRQESQQQQQQQLVTMIMIIIISRNWIYFYLYSSFINMSL